jgi:hypothetical protein
LSDIALVKSENSGEQTIVIRKYSDRTGIRREFAQACNDQASAL